MELLLSIVAVITVIIVYNISNESEFDIKVKEIECVLDSPDARKRKYWLFSELEKLTSKCRSYSELDKLQKLLGQVYDL